MKRMNFAAAMTVAFGVFAGTLNQAEAAASNDEVLQRLAALEKENTTLRQRVRRLEAAKPTAVTRAPAEAELVTGSIDRRSWGVPVAARSDARIYKGPAPYAAARFDWTGFYLGIHGGYGWKNDDFANVISVTPPVTVGGIESKGWVWGAQVGYNWQHGPWVAGLEIDFSQSNISGESAPGVIPIGGGASITQIQRDEVKWLGSARARLGFTPGGGFFSNLLVYGTAGLAWERVDQITTLTTVVPPFQVTTINRQPTDWFGWVAGVGMEAKLGGSNWIGRIEYLHYDFGSVQPLNTLITNIPGAVNFSDGEGGQTIDVVRAAISYKF